jgi:hypothetical protein
MEQKDDNGDGENDRRPNRHGVNGKSAPKLYEAKRSPSLSVPLIRPVRFDCYPPTAQA